MKLTRILLFLYFVLLSVLPMVTFIKEQWKKTDCCETYCKNCVSSDKCCNQLNNSCNKTTSVNTNFSAIFLLPSNEYSLQNLLLEYIHKNIHTVYKETIINSYISKIWQPPKFNYKFLGIINY